jgi:di/tricarboxylate transporter
MSPDAWMVFGLLALAVGLFISERVPLGLAALLIAGLLMAGGILTPAEGLSGFSSPATITITAMFVLSEGLRRTGALDLVGRFFIHVGKVHQRKALMVMMLTVGVISAFINNTAAIAIFIPVVLKVADEMQVSPSKLLMPISFTSMFGGACTLIGTSTNILVSSIAESHGLPGFAMFELTPLGLIFFGAGFFFLIGLGVRLIPRRRDIREQAGNYDLHRYLTDVVMDAGGELVGKPLKDSELYRKLDLDVLQVIRDGHRVPGNSEEIVLKAGDVLRVRGGVEEIKKLFLREDLKITTSEQWLQPDLEQTEAGLMEAVIAPDSSLERKRIDRVNFKQRFNAVPLAIQRGGRVRHENLGSIRLHAGDCLLLAVDADQTERLQQNRSFVLASQVPMPRYRREKMPIALLVIAGVVAATTLNLAPIVVNAVLGVVVLVLTGCLTNEEGYRAVNWEVVLLLAGVIPLGLAMDKTGAAQVLAGQVTATLGTWGPRAVLSGFLLLTMLLTEIMNNQASAALLAPMVIQVATDMEVDPRPFLMAVTYGASLSFMTPVGYQTNTLVYGPGQYHFTDFTRVGVWLNLLFWTVGSWLIPVLWPLQGR